MLPTSADPLLSHIIISHEAKDLGSFACATGISARFAREDKAREDKARYSGWATPAYRRREPLIVIMFPCATRSASCGTPPKAIA